MHHKIQAIINIIAGRPTSYRMCGPVDTRGYLPSGMRVIDHDARNN